MKNLINKMAFKVFRATIDKSENAIKTEVFRAFCEVGLNKDDFHEDFDLLKAGKLLAVMHLAGRRLNIDPELNTVGDVIKWLKS